MVIVLEAQAAVTPAGKPVAVPIPVAPVVVIVISVKAVLIHKVGVLDAVPAVFAGLTVTVVPVETELEQSPILAFTVYTPLVVAL